MQVIKEIKSIVKFPALGLLLFITIFGYIDFYCVLVLSKTGVLVKEILSMDSVMLIAADIGFLFAFLFMGAALVWFHVMIVGGFVNHNRLIGASVVLMDEGIKLKSRSKEAFIQNSSITYIYRSANKMALFIVWDGIKGAMTFALTRQAFGREAVEEADAILRTRKSYIDDRTQAEKIHNSIKKFRRIFWPWWNLWDFADGVGKEKSTKILS